MFENILSLAGSQYVILLLLLVVQASLLRRHVYFQYGVGVTMFLLAIYPVFFDCASRESFSLLFTIILIGYTAQLIYLATRGILPALVVGVIVGLYTLVFFVVSMSVNAALFFTKPVDAAIGLYEKGKKVATFSQKVYRERVVPLPSQSSETSPELDRE